MPNIEKIQKQSWNKHKAGKHLQHTLKNILNRYNTILFSKLVLCDEVKSHQKSADKTLNHLSYLMREEETDVDNVRHYDIQCQAVQMIKDLFQIKIKAIKFRIFDQLKENMYRYQTKLRISKKTENAGNTYSRLTLGATSHYGVQHNIKQSEFKNKKAYNLSHNVGQFADQVRKLGLKILKNTKNDHEASNISNIKQKKRRQILERLQRLEQNFAEFITQNTETELTSRSYYQKTSKNMNETMETKTDRVLQSRLKIKKY